MQAAEKIKSCIPERVQTLPVVNIQRTCVHDGPGIRTTLFSRVAD